ncbi:MAG: UDP-N-acetylenolpyruvoylglucosamine reductase [Candidatus Moranbacteria bacterium CG_4_8_14_3_um_filter_34_16]|nr:MAG: UDP-N-acetylenolpyruvoylglucosamine reductase [Candidatus Moranbacteria bacterium CG08_land_8_20_14_0_20_34_16]PIW94912.1 MAG: UDP-N-acetylenolpyruvoylglucosamine reductase [Candidatus Moranbacteria bacterium CG_4_8_14_3_um_filter_34_16]PJA89292.1 MAG: UDP-N-acetylenolpyruvoylglucosamine reductase [Candidatus Moranbacteria bacterium CG_4_9_14_3_um_filter_33_15]
MLKIEKNVILAPLTTFKIGGPAKFFCKINQKEELREAFDFAQKNNLELFILGGGSNILINDNGFGGLVIRLQNSAYKFSSNRVFCDAGVNLSKIVSQAFKNNLSGMEWAVGIPGTVGGAIRGNAGAYGGSMANVLESVDAVEIKKEQKKFPENFSLKKYFLSDCKFGYRDSIFKKNRNLIIWSCVFELQTGEKNEIEKKMKDIVEKRTDKLPAGFSAGSFFQNPTVKNEKLIAKFETYSGTKCREGKIPAGWLIEEVGLRGKKIGGAKVSEKHANFVINLGKAKAEDIVVLSSLIKQKVRVSLGVQLKEEIQYIGF